MVHAGPGYGRALLYRENCATCHGKENAEGTPDWKTLMPTEIATASIERNRSAWHHPLDILAWRTGGALWAGMPALPKLDEAQIDAILAWVQSHWSDDRI